MSCSFWNVFDILHSLSIILNEVIFTSQQDSCTIIFHFPQFINLNLKKFKKKNLRGVKSSGKSTVKWFDRVYFLFGRVLINCKKGMKHEPLIIGLYMSRWARLNIQRLNERLNICPCSFESSYSQHNTSQVNTHECKTDYWLFVKPTGSKHIYNSIVKFKKNLIPEIYTVINC